MTSLKTFLLVAISGAAALHVPAVQPRCAIEMRMKGRHVGGGPSISTRKKKRATADVRRENVRVMAARKEALRGTNKAPELQRQRQQDRHSSLLAMGATAHVVFARVAPSARAEFTENVAAEGWVEVGEVSFDEAQHATAEQAAWLHKRLVLEHACRLYPNLIPHRESLELGLAATADDTPAVVDRCESILAMACGFLETSDPYAGHYWAESEQTGSEGKKVILDGIGLDTKSATAMAFSKSLSLRSG